MFSRPPFVGRDVISHEDKDIYMQLWKAISLKGAKKRGPILEQVLSNPGAFGIKNVVRSELMKIVYNSLEKTGFVGRPEDFRVQARLFTVLKLKAQQDEGGLF